jgi:hypothetical protein
LSWPEDPAVGESLADVLSRGTTVDGVLDELVLVGEVFSFSFWRAAVPPPRPSRLFRKASFILLKRSSTSPWLVSMSPLGGEILDAFAASVTAFDG